MRTDGGRSWSAGLGLLAVAVLLQLVPYGRDHTNPR